ncbi:hypothetical protein HMN09_00601700 [Mycena chlorophos]|uniref:Uncharacterized protein n=1 Tax=Mycena chlorophos TaxID=658473 RepID=A0A8H6W9D2_MYCCL|nr:hypothetical protein HMN09_00601700 [Mycena chlorophos]
MHPDKTLRHLGQLPRQTWQPEPLSCLLMQRSSWLVVLSVFCSVAATQATDLLGFLDQSFYFSYTPATQAVPVLVTAQCETIHITWSRGQGTGPDPVAPYFLQIYTSAFVFPFIVGAGDGLDFDWQVPFGPGTSYQICMCTDISVRPKNGTAPYTFTVAPALHPPHNQTGSDQGAMNWTVNLSWGSPFFISVVDAEMNFWSYGPLHSGQGSSVSCLSGPNADQTKFISPLISGLIGLGGIVLGLFAGIATTLIFRGKRKTEEERALLELDADGPGPFPFDASNSAPVPTHYKYLPSSHVHGASTNSSPNSSSQRMRRHSTHYHIEPYVPVHENIPSEAVESRTVTSPTAAGRNVYVVHHDAGRPPVTLYPEDGVQVVELPPEYPNRIPDSRVLRLQNPDERAGGSEDSASLTPVRRLNRTSKE